MNINYFIGKLVMIITVPNNKTFPETKEGKLEYFEYFLGILVAVDDKGVIIKNLTKNLHSFFCFHNIVSIVEEQMVNKSDPISPKLDEIAKQDKEVVIAPATSCCNNKLTSIEDLRKTLKK